MWLDLWPWLLGGLVVVLGAVALWLVLRRPRKRPPVDDRHGLALQRWVAGDLVGARDLLADVVRREPQHPDPYLHLGVLYRLTGDAGRAAALHRSLAVRPGLSRERRVAVGLELAADLVALHKWPEATEVLTQLTRAAARDPRWYQLSFATALGRDDHEGALAALRAGEKNLEGAHATECRTLRAAWLSDRALMHARAEQLDQARGVLGKLKGLPETEGRRLLVEALIGIAAQDADATMKAVTRGLETDPTAIAPVLGSVEGLLVDRGRITQLVAVLETACRDEATPPAVWMALARLYEKLDRREDALRLMAGKRGDPRLTPDAAAPYMRLLTAGFPDAAFTQLWNILSDPAAGLGYRCQGCGRWEDRDRWFCPECLAPNSFGLARESQRPVVTTDSEAPAEPPRY